MGKSYLNNSTLMNLLLFGKMDFYKRIDNMGTAETQKTYFSLTLAFAQSERGSSQMLRKIR